MKVEEVLKSYQSDSGYDIDKCLTELDPLNASMDEITNLLDTIGFDYDRRYQEEKAKGHFLSTRSESIDACQSCLPYDSNLFNTNVIGKTRKDSEEQIIEQYAKSIRSCPNDDSIELLRIFNLIRCLPNYKDFILQLKIKLLGEKVNAYYTANNHSLSLDERELNREEYLSLLAKIDLLKEYQEEYEFSCSMATAPEDKRYQLLYLHSASGNVYFSSDVIHSIGEDAYSCVIKAINDLRRGILTNTKAVAVPQGVWQKREEKIRVIFCKLGSNTFLILGAFYKNCESYSQSTAFYFNRYNQFLQNKEAILATLNMPQELEYHKIVTDDILNYAKTNQKGVRK